MKSVTLPSQGEALARHLDAGIPLESLLPPREGNLVWGSRLMAEPDGNNAENWAIRKLTT